MATEPGRFDRAVGIGLFVRAQGRAREDALAWMRAEGVDEPSATSAWEQSAHSYRALLRRFARRDLVIAVSITGVAALTAALSYEHVWAGVGYVIAFALLGLAVYAGRYVPNRMRGQASRADLEMQRWMRERHPDLPGA